MSPSLGISKKGCFFVLMSLLISIILLVLTSISLVAEGRVCIGHGGSMGYAPMHTMASYKLGLEQGADYLEMDLQVTKDGHLVSIHDFTLEATTNVEEVFPKRFRKTKIGLDGKVIHKKNWPVVDFTLEEIKRLDAGSWFGKEFSKEKVPTFQEILDLIRSTQVGHLIGIYPEIKDPHLYEKEGKDIVADFHKFMVKNNLHTKEGQQKIPVIVQGFYPESLVKLKEISSDAYQILQLVWLTQKDELLSDGGLKKVKSYASGVGPYLSMLEHDESRAKKIRELGLFIHPWGLKKKVPKRFPSRRSYYDYLFKQRKYEGLFVSFVNDCFEGEKKL